MEGLDVAKIYPLIDLAVAEDLGTGDVTSILLCPEGGNDEAAIVAREAMVVCGMTVVREVLARYHTDLRVEALCDDGASVGAGEVLAKVTGPLAPMLSAERVFLNFLQRLCGIATLTRRYVQAVEGTPAHIYDTRKTIPGWRLLEKYAVRCGGGHNHRFGLYDAVLIKDNHLAGLGEGLGAALERMVNAVRGKVDFVAVEVDGIEDQLPQVLAVTGIDVVLLDNMTTDQLKRAVAMRNEVSGGRREPCLEASGGITLETIRAVAQCGVERIAVGAITHGAVAVDIGLDR